MLQLGCEAWQYHRGLLRGSNPQPPTLPEISSWKKCLHMYKKVIHMYQECSECGQSLHFDKGRVSPQLRWRRRRPSRSSQRGIHGR